MTEDKVSIVSDYLIQSTTCAYLKMKKMNLGSLGSSTIGIYTKGGWSVHLQRVCAQLSDLK